ncbi:MAG TPA: DNA repair protein RadC [Chthoniobacterales bacterium]
MSRLKELPESELPRERLARHGTGALSNSELIAILLRVGTEGTNVLELADGLLRKYNNLTALARCPVAELSKIKGIGPAKAIQLAAAFALGNRLARETIANEPFDKPELIHQLLAGEMRALNTESLRVILLDTRFHLIRIEEISHGSAKETLAPLPEILKAVITGGASGFILIHNHPSGDPTPSQADRALTRRLAEAGQLLQLNFLDHIIFGAPSTATPGYFSFREAGIL